MIRAGDQPWDERSDAHKCVFQDETSDITFLHVGAYQPNGDSTSQTLAIYDDLVSLEVLAGANVIQCRLRINAQSLFVGLARREAIASVLDKENVAVKVFSENFGNGQAMTDVACVAMKHNDGDIAGILGIWRPNEKGMEIDFVWRPQ